MDLNPKTVIVHFARERRNFRRIARILGPVILEQVEKEQARGLADVNAGSRCWRSPVGPQSVDPDVCPPGQHLGHNDEQVLVTPSPAKDAAGESPPNTEGKEEAEGKRLVWAWKGPSSHWPFA